MGADYEADVAAQRVVVIEADDRSKATWSPGRRPTPTSSTTSASIRRCQGEGLGRRLIEHAAAEAARLRLPALRLYTNAAMSENLSMYAHLGFVETHRASRRAITGSTCAGTSRQNELGLFFQILW